MLVIAFVFTNVNSGFGTLLKNKIIKTILSSKEKMPFGLKRKPGIKLAVMYFLYV